MKPVPLYLTVCHHKKAERVPCVLEPTGKMYLCTLEKEVENRCTEVEFNTFWCNFLNHNRLFLFEKVQVFLLKVYTLGC